VKIRVSSVEISDRIPNVFNARALGVPLNNTTLRVGTDTQPYLNVTLEAGLYLTAAMINAAINAAINSLHWWLVPSDPGLTITENTIIDRFVVKIDSSKLAPAYGTQFKLDMRESTTGSTFYKLIGFSSTSELTLDGPYTSSVLPVMDTQGTTCIICCSIMPARLVNSNFQQYVATVSFAGKTTASDNLWPPGNVGNDEIVYPGSRTITQANTYVVTEDGLPMVFMNGRLIVELLFYW